MLKETRSLNELSGLYESINKTHTLDSKINFIIEKNNLSFYNKTALKDIVKQVVYNEQATEQEKIECLDLFIEEINKNTLTEQRSEEILNEFLGRLGKWAADKWDVARSAGQTIGSAFNRTGQGVVSSPAQSFANRLERIAKAVETLQKECLAAGPGNTPITKWWETLKTDPAGSHSTGMDHTNMPSGEFFKLMGSDERARDPRVKRFMKAISQILPSLSMPNTNPFITVNEELRKIAWNRRTSGAGAPGRPTPSPSPETSPISTPAPEIPSAPVPREPGT